MQETKKYISPNNWFSFEYPAQWFEFEDGEGSFLFYNPNAWDGNFRISGIKGDTSEYGQQLVQQEIAARKQAKSIQLAQGPGAYELSSFEEDNQEFVSHQWVYGVDDMVFYCTFTSLSGQDSSCVEQILNSIEVRDLNKKYPAELIPIRLSEIYLINEAYEWVITRVKEQLTVDFQGVEEDLDKLEKLKASETIGKKNRNSWQALGLTIGVILTHEIEGMEWYTLIDGNREDPVLIYEPTQKMIDPMKLVWSKIRAGEEFSIPASYTEVLASLH